MVHSKKENTAIVTWTASNVASNVSRNDAQLLSQSVLLEETNPPTIFRNIVLSILTLVAFFIVWASMSQFAERATAQGEILPSNRIHTVQHENGGVIAEVLVSEGDIVSVGDLLLKMDAASIEGAMKRLYLTADTLAIGLERRRAFVERRDVNFSDYTGQYQTLIDDERAVFRQAVANRDARMGVAHAQIAAGKNEIAGILFEIESVKEQVAALGETLAIREELAAKGSSSKVQLLSTRHDHAEAKANLASKMTSMARAEASLAGAEARLIENTEALTKTSLEQITRMTSELLEVQAEVAALDKQISHSVLRATVAGQVSGVVDVKAGNVIRSGQIIMTVVPTEGGLTAEVRLSPKDVGYVKVGMPVLVRIDTYRYGRMGGINGFVERISADTMEDENGVSYFRTWVTLDQNYVGVDPSANRVIPGMTVSADIRTGEKSLMAYLMRPVHQSLSKAFGER